MSKRNNALLLVDILTAIDKIQTYTEGLDFESFMADNRTIDAVERNFEIIGEAANQLTSDFREATPHIRWHGIISFRNRLIHGYFGVDYQILWYLLQNEIPQLKIDLQNIS
jgi:uncharacterized protein with HEPN domain